MPPMQAYQADEDGPSSHAFRNALLSQIEAPAREGAYVHGLFMEGARWDLAHGCIEDSRIKELYICMPVLLMRYCPALTA